jgi:hypothetical protein
VRAPASGARSVTTAARTSTGRLSPTAAARAALTGSSPADFPAEHYERSWPDRFGPDRLNDIGRRGMGLG